MSEKPSTLVLRRSTGETLLIGNPPDTVAVTIGQVDDEQVTLVCKGPRRVAIDRLEVARKKAKNSK